MLDLVLYDLALHQVSGNNGVTHGRSYMKDKSRAYHAWQATLDEDAVVFTTLPGNEPRPGDRWDDADLYWSGIGAMPRSAQQGAAAIHLYAPEFAPNGPGPLEAFTYLPYTHAYFPAERFAEVRQVGG